MGEAEALGTIIGENDIDLETKLLYEIDSAAAPLKS